MSDRGRRRALVIGVGQFDEPAAGFDCLPFSVGLAEKVASVLEGYRDGGFEVCLLTDPDQGQIHEAWMALRNDRSVLSRVVHVISHGRWSMQRRVEVVGRCTSDGANNVGEWVSSAQDGGVPTLFLVDLCGAGRAADLDFLVEPRDGELMAWVLAGARGDERAFDGAFTQVAVKVLQECARDGLGTAPRRPYVDLGDFARRVKDDLRGQTPQMTKVDMSWSSPNILPNPLYVHDRLADLAAGLDGPLQPFLADAVADVEHFQGRAGAFFTGRQSLLDVLVPWLDGAGQGGLWVVTGAAGSGKSAVLGALVCAAHPALHEVAGQVRRRMADPPQPNPHLVAVHARQRSLADLIESVARQLDLPAPKTGWDAAELITQIAGLADPPVLIIDALDECPQAAAVQAVLLMPLAMARRSDSRAAVRLLVGARPWRDQFAPLLDHAAASGQLTDLDQTSRPELYRDLRKFLLDQLTDIAGWDEVLASGIAARLADDHEQRRHDSAAARWGHFLVASRYISYIREHPPRNDDDTQQLITQVPVELPQVLEMELAAHPRPHHLRAALTALAYAKGDGMPIELLREITPTIGPADPGLFTSNDVRLYIRTGSDDSGVSLLRLYHQGLADYLREHPLLSNEIHDLTGPVTTALLFTRDTARGPRSWEHAPPYLHRHAIQHAADAGIADTLIADPEYLVFADPEPLLQTLDHAHSDAARLGAAVYRSTHHLLSPDPHLRRRLIQLTYLRYTSGQPRQQQPGPTS